jgi:zinc transport system ATP-binding protein
MATDPLIEIKDLTFSYDKVPVLEKVNLTVSRGEFIGIFGPNGGGKTTFLKLLMGFLKPSAGSIHLANPKIGYVPQVTRFDKQFPISVLEIVLMGLLSESTWWGGFSKGAKKQAEQALDQVGLLDKQHQAFGTLSGGQAQRALIARAIAGGPELLFLDEPTANIDPAAEEEIYELLLKLKSSMTILMVTHDLQDVIYKVDRLLCIHRSVTPFLPKEICEHFALGLYHPPLVRRNP